jgi:uncharacterized protein
VDPAAIIAALPPSVPATHRKALLSATELWTRLLGSRLVSLVLFGSVARGDARESSDIDLLVIARAFPTSLAERRRPLIEGWLALRRERGLPAVEWNLVTKTPDEARDHSPLYLDMVEDAVLLVDHEHFFAAVLERMRQRMRELGSRRVFLPDGSWYWDLCPSFRFGQVVEL